LGWDYPWPEDKPLAYLERPGGGHRPNEIIVPLPLGEVVATATLADVVPVDQLDADPYGDFTPGRFGWVLDDIERLDPSIPATGRQGLWTWGER
jgi:hypothetical protein